MTGWTGRLRLELQRLVAGHSVADLYLRNGLLPSSLRHLEALREVNGQSSFEPAKGTLAGSSSDHVAVVAVTTRQTSFLAAGRKAAPRPHPAVQLSIAIAGQIVRHTTPSGAATEPLPSLTAGALGKSRTLSRSARTLPTPDPPHPAHGRSASTLAPVPCSASTRRAAPNTQPCSSRSEAARLPPLLAARPSLPPRSSVPAAQGHCLRREAIRPANTPPAPRPWRLPWQLRLRRTLRPPRQHPRCPPRPDRFGPGLMEDRVRGCHVPRRTLCRFRSKANSRTADCRFAPAKPQRKARTHR